MLLSIQFPLADCRRFINTDTGVLYRPGWPRPTVDDEFVRSFGAVRVRLGGGVHGWLGEDNVCEARRAVRFPALPTYVDQLERRRIPLRCAFRRFFFEGSAVGKYEVGVIARIKRGHSVKKLITADLLEYFLSLKVNIRTEASEVSDVKLIDAGSQVARLYAASSARRVGDAAAPDGEQDKLKRWWVQHGSPLLLLEYKTKERFTPPFPTRAVKVPEEYGFKLSHGLMDFQGKRIRTWLLALRSDYDWAKARTLRLYLLRLHAEHECLKIILRNIKAKKINPPPGSNAYKELQKYLSATTRRITKWEGKSGALVEPEVAELARRSEDSMSPGEALELLKDVANLGIEKDISRKVDVYIDTVALGDVFKNIEDSTIVTRGAVNAIHGASPGEIERLRKEGSDRLKETAAKFSTLISDAPEAALPSEHKEVGLAQLTSVTQELEKQQPDAARLQELFVSLWEAVRRTNLRPAPGQDEVSTSADAE